MARAGYVRHCVEAGKTCYHRRLHAPHRFPRFHAFVTINGPGMDIDLHIDQHDLQGESSHGYEWAYRGGRVNSELDRLVNAIKSPPVMKQVNQANNPSFKKREPKPKKKRSIYQILFK